MPKVKKVGSTTKKLAGKMIAFVGKFGYGKQDLEAMNRLATEEGGTVVECDKSAPDLLVAGAGVGGNPPAAVAKLQKKYPQMLVVDEVGFYQATAPTTEEFLAILQKAPQDYEGYEFWSTMGERLRKSGVQLDLTGNDFRNLNLGHATLYNVTLDECDFRGAMLEQVYFDKVKNAKFDGATMVGGSFSKAEDCCLKKVTMNDVRWNPAVFQRCDFTGAKLAIRIGSYTTATDCICKKADLGGSHLERSKFTNCDFSGAILVNAQLEKCDFTGSNLAGADLSQADLRNAKLTNTDLRKAKFGDAHLSRADLTGAIIDGADFTGANLTNVNVTGLDTSKAKNLQPVAARAIGPKMRELAKVASESKRFLTSIELDLGNDEVVTLNPSLSRYENQTWASAYYHHQPKHSSITNSADAPTFEQGVFNLIDLWSRGIPKFDTVKVKAKECPLRGKELQELAVAAWYEACGLDIPTAEELQKLKEQTDSENADIRETMLGELTGGAAGIKKWNARSDKNRSQLGRLRKYDFTNVNLAGAYLQNQDFEGSTFDGTNLKDSYFGNSQLKGASFARAKMRDSNLAGSKCAEASFEAAQLTGCNLRAASFRRCNFQNADLSKADFSYSDLGGADFTDATLAEVTFTNTKFDENTVFPAGFVLPDGLVWKGVGQRPVTPAPVPPPKSGALDFDTFLKQLNNKVELARMQKAGSMLKAERFQLFAEVKEDALVGIVKSQSSHDLVYSCRLASNGAFSCCTQNLRPCGGLRGALCKHLLVLIVGLAKAGQLDSATVDHWIDLSRSQKPAIDEDAMSATFLRYKGAEAGEVDWRPTETIPEDFYAM